MKKSNLITVSAAVLLLSVQSAAAQVCVTPPTCDALGYNKSASQCTGMTMLQCPLDQSKVYCPSADEINSSGTYKVGDYYYYNNNAVGKVIAVKGTDLTVASIPSAATEVSTEGLASYCSSLNSAAAAWTPIATKDDCTKAKQVWSELGNSWNGTIITSGNSHYCSNNCFCYSTPSSSNTYYYVCLSTFKA